MQSEMQNSTANPDIRHYRQTIARLPVTMRPSLTEQLAGWNKLFKFERDQLIAFLEGVDSFDAASLDVATSRLRALEGKMAIDGWGFSETHDTIENAVHLARSPYYLQWRQETHELFEAIENRKPAPAANTPAPHRLILLFLPESLPVDRAFAASELNSLGREVHIAGDSRKLRNLATDRDSGLCSKFQRLENHDDAALWMIDADNHLGTNLNQSAVTAISYLSYSSLKPLRDEVLMQVNQIPKAIDAADQTISQIRQTDWSRWWPKELAGRDLLLNFVVNLYLSGNGALIFSNAFVEWAASEAIRRARPQAMMACFGMRSKPKPFTGIAIFENQEKSSPLPAVDDPENSAIDAVILARYIWLAARKYPEYSNALFICVIESLNTAYILSPSESGYIDQISTADDLYRCISSWFAS